MTTPSVSDATRSVRKRQLMVLSGVGLALIGVVVAASFTLQDRAAPAMRSVERPVTKPLSSPVTGVEQQAFATATTDALATMKKDIEELRKSRDEALAAQKRAEEAAQRDREALLKRIEDAKSPPAPVPGNGPTPPPTPPGGFGRPGSPFSQAGMNPPAPGELGMPPGQGAISQGPSTRLARAQPVSMDVGAARGPLGPGVIVPQGPPTAHSNSAAELARSSNEAAPRLQEDEPLTGNRAGGRTAENYLPAGTFMRAVLLNGLDAPTGGNANQSPHPVLLRVVDIAQLPNGFKADLKDCVLTANGFGDVSAERAYMRTDRMSCVDNNGGAVDVAVRGYIAGEDGKSGVRGRLVTKTGQILSNALLSSIGSGIGAAFRAQGTTISTNPLGTQTETVNNAFKNGLGTGMGKAFDQLAAYYITLADKTFPVIEVDAGRVVDVVIQKGLLVGRTSQNQ